tara:strand:- start:243 stop:416 length:174 start_codon:yes stop_codon:yes gene_type:complete
MQYRYFHFKDKNKETVGVVNTDTLEDAYVVASKIKKLPLESFKKLFKIEKMTRMFHS